MRVSIITLTVNLACRPMEKMEKWPHPTMDHSDQFEFDHFVRAFDVAQSSYVSLEKSFTSHYVSASYGVTDADPWRLPCFSGFC